MVGVLGMSFQMEITGRTTGKGGETLISGATCLCNWGSGLSNACVAPSGPQFREEKGFAISLAQKVHGLAQKFGLGPCSEDTWGPGVVMRKGVGVKRGQHSQHFGGFGSKHGSGACGRWG